MNIETGNYEFNTNLVVNFTREEVIQEVEKYFQRYDIRFRKEVFCFLEECMKDKNLKFRKLNRC